MIKKKKRVLVTAIGTVTATAIVKRLIDAENFYIIGTDINNEYEIATSIDVDEYYRFPMADSNGYLEYVIEFCKAHKVDFYYAVIDVEVVLIARNIDKFYEIGTKPCVVAYETARICHYKDIFSNWIREFFPEIWIKTYEEIDNIQESNYPLFLKPIEGVAGDRCRKIEDRNELNQIVERGQLCKDYILQEYVEGSVVTVDCVRCKKTNKKIQVQRRELLRNSNGCGIAVEIIHDDKLEDICNDIMEWLDLNGVINIEFFYTDTGFRIIEINPRFSAGTLYTCMSGVDTVICAMRIADGEKCEFGNVEIGNRFAERYEPYKMSKGNLTGL